MATDNPADPRFVYELELTLGGEAVEKARCEGRLRKFVCDEILVWVNRMLSQMHLDNKDYGQDFVFKVSGIPKCLSDDN
jgi:hypothetical protein